MKVPPYVEVETSRYCNRMCKWCPNHLHRQRRVQEYMSWSILQGIVNSLARVNFDGWFAFHNYNEPLENPRLLNELKLIRSIIPRARPTVYTNGDSLTAVRYEELCAAGLAQMRVTVYPTSLASGKASHDTLWTWLEKRPFLLHNSWVQVTARQGPSLISRGSPELILISPNIDNYYDRGGTISWLSIQHRKEPCLLTAHSLSIDYQGNIKMCCNVMMEIGDHHPYILGNVKNIDVITAWNSPRFEALRKLHAECNWSTTPICKTCRQVLRLGADNG